jgi:hypothetical protein
MVSKKKVTTSLSAMDVLLGKDGQTRSIPLVLSEHYPTVLSVARSDVTGLLNNNPGLHITQARELLQRAQAMSVVTARQFREQRLTASVREANRPPTGIKGLVEGPTYTDMFNPDWANHCPPDAIEATTSPVAYLADLYRYAKELEATGKPGEVITLDARRPDLKDLMLDHTALNRVEPTIVLVNEILETSIRSHLDGIALEDKTVDDALLEARYPNALPFERYTSQINYVLGRKGYSLGDVIRLADPAYPYFKEPGVHSALSDTALIQDTGFGPVQQALLLEAPYFPDADGQTRSLIANKWRVDPRTRLLVEAVGDELQATPFFQDNFGVGGPIDLEDTQTFCLRTGLKTEELEALLSVGAFAPGRSANVAATAQGGVDGSLAGSVYINGGQPPAMAIETLPGTLADGVLVEGPRHRITNASADRFDRMNRMIRLARWMDLPFDEVDQLLVASMQGEQRAATVTRRTLAAEVASTYVITQNTLRALGLFQSLRKNYQVEAADFAALLYGVSVYARGKSESQFDQIFNSQALFSIPLIMDDTPFVITPKTDAERQKIDHLCAALGMTYETYRFVVKVIEQTYAGDRLTWSREVISAFYRLVKLPRYIGLTTVEALALLELLDGGGSQLMSKLAGVTEIATHYASADTDTLSVLHALVDFSSWLKESKWTVAQLCRLLLPSATQPIATDAEGNLLQEMHSRLTSALITDSSFAQVGAPDVSVTASEPIDWFAELAQFIDSGQEASAAKGLVKYLTGETEETFEKGVSTEVKLKLESYGLMEEELHSKLTNMIMRARGAQEALLMEGLGNYLNTSAGLAKALLTWTEGNRYQLLLEVVRVYGESLLGTVAIGDEVLLVLDALAKRAAVSSHLSLSPALITQLVEHSDWFGLEDAELSLQKVFFLSQYAMILRLSEQNEDTLLDYFRLINTLWQESNDGDKRLIRDSAANKLAGFLRWSVREVLSSAFHVEPETGVIFTLCECDTTVRIALLSRDTGLDANALLALHLLTPTSSTELYRQAAGLALSCLTESPPGSSAGEIGQSLSSVITVAPDYLVANRPHDSATYTITLCDFMDNPFDGVTVRWSVNLGELDQVETTTDESGVSSTTLHSGTTVGLASLVASFGLGETLKAPLVTIDCDEQTIHFVEGEYGPSTALANKLEPINFSVMAVDDYGNKAVDRAIEWGATLGEFQRYQTITDQSGISHAQLRSRSAGISEAIAQYKNGRDWEFIAVEFVSIPYFQYVRFFTTVVVGVEVSVVCRLVELDGTPRVGEKVSWSSDVGELLDEESVTDDDGVATVRYVAADVGMVIVAAAAAAPIVTKSTGQTVINPLATIVHQEASSEEFLVGSADPIVFKVWLEMHGEVAPRTLVEWSTSEGGSSISYSDHKGIATFNSKFKRGEQSVTATISGTDDLVIFNVTAMPPVEFSVTMEGDRFDDESPDLLSRIATYYLVVKTADEAGESIEGVEFSLDFVGDHPSLIGLNIEGLSQKHISTAEGLRFKIKAEPGDRGIVALKLTGALLEEWRETYRLGWIYQYSTARLPTSEELDLRWTCKIADLDPYDGAIIENLGVITFSVPEHQVEVSLPVRLAGRPLYQNTPAVDISSLKKGNLTKVTRLVALDGYLIMPAGELVLD